jgi:membrane-bound metal-dependent hydrolase YbcI (DUF457 family)
VGLAVGTLGTLGTAGTLGAIAAAVAPDLDFLWGRHNMETHSLGAAIAAGVVVWIWKRNVRLAVAVTLAWTSHVLFDWLGSDTTPPLGVMALWPMSSEYYFSDAFFFEAISRRYWLDNFITHNVWAVIKEVVILGPPLALVTAVRWRARRRSRRPDTALPRRA